MLILTRRVGESVVIGDDIVVTVVEVRGDSVRIGIQAPRSVDVHREEVYEELRRTNESAASPAPDAIDALRGLVVKPSTGAGGTTRMKPGKNASTDRVGLTLMRGSKAAMSLWRNQTLSCFWPLT